ncbi:MAG TPA: murein biosynthesis integral membrane protein MurJ [Roseiflexaceae bacterium]|nr:murein biosynthesis integral membrane protein MurJ [Roseiflexaceae bacterium]
MQTNSRTARRIAVAALLIAVGNIASRLIGIVREAVIAWLFGRGADVAVFTAASAMPTIVYDLLINGAISAALVPVFSAYAEADDDEFWRVAASITTIALAAVTFVTGLLIWQAPLAVTILAGGFNEDLREQAILTTQLLLPATISMALSGLITALLQARQKFLLPAFTTSAFNIGVIAAALLLTPLLGPLSLVIGVLAGSFLQVILQLPGLRGVTFRLRLELGHPGVRRILKLYAPVALGIGFSVAGIIIDRNLASRLDPGTIPTMRYATTLIQFPLGLVAAAVSFAVLPTLSRLAANRDEEQFRATLAMGIKVVTLLILPATAGLAVLGTPIVELLYQRGAFEARDTAATARALLFYLPGLPAAAIDQMLLFAFYARNRTLAPNLVQGVAIGIYALVAIGLLSLSTLRIEALILGNTAQWIGHVIILLLLSRRLIDLRGLRIGEALVKCLIASGVLAVATALLSPLLESIGGSLLALAGGGILAGGAYLGVCIALRVEAIEYVMIAIRMRLRHNIDSKK